MVSDSGLEHKQVQRLERFGGTFVVGSMLADDAPDEISMFVDDLSRLGTEGLVRPALLYRGIRQCVHVVLFRCRWSLRRYFSRVSISHHDTPCSTESGFGNVPRLIRYRTAVSDRFNQSAAPWMSAAWVMTSLRCLDPSKALSAILTAETADPWSWQRYGVRVPQILSERDYGPPQEVRYSPRSANPRIDLVRGSRPSGSRDYPWSGCRRDHALSGGVWRSRQSPQHHLFLR